MTYVVTEGCVKCKRMDCVEVCPVDAFHEGDNMLVINPEECIDCTVCIPACPEKAIYRDGDVPTDQQQFITLNAKYAEEWPVIDEQGDVPEDADQWSGVKGKVEHI